ncbi:hypothetical protein LO763_11725 [Glycomyces sp. A-F 0318]|uniref:hypothetical protein n=1 Tax=Glycomyces amatae TaxID=2881355 RepID=UPI001E2CAD43|nr:hypothetical protein [Glycomyces amatae]MCD0444291.1 hypothetical protein [Glycomyces amatae]
MNHDHLTTALRIWAAAAPDSLYSGSRWIFACWQEPDGSLTVSALFAASDCLDAATYDEDDARPDAPIPAPWVEFALDVDGLVFDLVTERPGRPCLLAGVGVAAAARPGPREDANVHAWMATGKAAIAVELHRHGAAVGQCEVGDPLWWDRQELFEPLERFRAAATGWPPALPESLTAPASRSRSAVPWNGPC